MWVDGDLALQNFKTWLQTVSGLPDYDHAMSFTGYVFSVLLFKFIYTYMKFFFTSADFIILRMGRHKKVKNN